eukprot:COSAG01_NODE_21017_length_922_cov_1.061968_1_plen_254_part_00
MQRHDAADADSCDGDGSSGTEYASSDDGAFPFADEDHVDHFGTFSSEGDSFAPLIETPLLAVRRMLEIARLQPTDKLVDVGCGDGRIVVEAAKHFGCEVAVGIDLFDDRLGSARELAASKGVGHCTNFLQADAREFDLTPFDIIVVFLLPEALALLLPKLRESLTRGARVASYWFPIEQLVSDPGVLVTTDPSGELRIFVYSSCSAHSHGEGGGGKVECRNAAAAKPPDATSSPRLGTGKQSWDVAGNRLSLA